MTGPDVLIVSQLFDPGVDAVSRGLTDRGVTPHRLNVEEFPLLTRSSIAVSSTEPATAEVDLATGRVEVGRIGAVWFRRVARAALPSSMATRDRDFAQGEAAAYVNGLLSLPTALWVNDRAAETSMSSKAVQLATARRFGFAIPDTLITNDREKAVLFSRRHPQVIFKPLSGYSPRSSDFTRRVQDRFAAFGPVHAARDEGDEVEVAFTQVLTPDKLKTLDLLPFAPVIFQELIPKSADLRVTVVGRELFACRIHSQEREETMVDFRRMALLDGSAALRHDLVLLDERIAGRILDFMECAGLQFGCLDFVERPDGELVFLEINPSGQWLWIEHRTGAAISDAIAALLSRSSERGSAPPPEPVLNRTLGGPPS